MRTFKEFLAEEKGLSITPNEVNESVTLGDVKDALSRKPKLNLFIKTMSGKTMVSDVTIKGSSIEGKDAKSGKRIAFSDKAITRIVESKIDEAKRTKLPNIDKEVDIILQRTIKSTNLDFVESGVDSRSFDVTLDGYSDSEKGNLATLISALEKKFKAHQNKEMSSFGKGADKGSVFLDFVFDSPLSESLEESKSDDMMIKLADLVSPEEMVFLIAVANGRGLKDKKEPKGVDTKSLMAKGLLDYNKNTGWAIQGNQLKFLKENDTMKSFKEFVSEGKEEAAAIRAALKKELGLSSRDVSVKSNYGGYSSSVNVSIKTTKALASMSKIKEIGSSKESYERDERSGEILMGGNTFIFTEIDWKFRKSLGESIDKEYQKVTKGGLAEGESIVLYKFFTINHFDAGHFIITIKGSSKVTSMNNDDYVGSGILSFIEGNGDDSMYAKIK